MKEYFLTLRKAGGAVSAYLVSLSFAGSGVWTSRGESAAVWLERKRNDIYRSTNGASDILNDGEENGYYKW